ncbi:MAG: MCP four helix bundle domain-containing protein [Oceanospirillaceae bacterium]|nr:MCP four helix bundle domain-containing protein [Oceanospirillaceae bacterium]MCP5336042.1 MCP four helix bundle domain-containing protein [Oceanospirillaceae bacterium]MCP5349666.1 MCP four helix bundle domain-containing protein [Oceanospirillaceae bacterium]
MPLSVTARIAGGFAVLMLLTLCLVVVGMLGLGSIKSALHGVTEESIPLLDQISAMENHVLESQLRLNRFLQEKNTAELDQIEQRYRQDSDIAQKLYPQIMSLAAGQASIEKTLTETGPLLNTIKQQSDKAITDYRAALQQQGAVLQHKRKVGDSADQLSVMVGVFRKSHAAAVTNFIQHLDALNEFAFKTLLSDIPPAIRGADKRIAKMLQNLDDDVAAFKGNSDSVFSTEFATYKSLLQGPQSLMLQHVKTVEYFRSAKELEAEVNKLQAQLSESFSGISAQVKSLSEETAQQARSAVNGAMALMTIIAIVALALSVVISLLLIRNIRSRLNDVVEYMHLIASGDLRRDIEITSNDELGKVAMSANGLVDKLRTMLRELGGGAEKLADSANHMANISDKSLRGIMTQKEQTDVIATSTAEMSSTVQEVARNVTETLHKIEDADRDVALGKKELNTNIHLIHQLAENIQASGSVIQKVSEDSANIGSVLDVIRGIAEQTNLLALNAAIEAARAGEQGRGFAVVADEVRTLASKTQASTTEIHEMIQRLQSGVEEAVAMMEKSQHDAANSVSHITQAGERLEEISNAMGAIKGMSAQIASATEQQAAATKEQHQNVVMIADAAEETAHGARESNTASTQLAGMAKTLRTLAGQFRI